jgi:hypothetical protein
MFENNEELWDCRERPKYSGDLFGFDFLPDVEPRGEVVGLFVEDDGFWHLKMTFNKHWLPDLLENIEDILEDIENE